MIKVESRRFYPLAEESSQLIGFTDKDDMHGSEGLERSFDSLLIGKNGKQIIRKDAKGNIVENIRSEKQYDPQDVMLSIDEELQSMVYGEIKKRYRKIMRNQVLQFWLMCKPAKFWQWQMPHHSTQISGIALSPN